MMITNHRQYEAAQARIEQLTSGDFVDLSDVEELRTLLLAATAWEKEMRTSNLPPMPERPGGSEIKMPIDDHLQK